MKLRRPWLPRRVYATALSACYLGIGLTLFALILGGIFAVRLAQGPITMDWLVPQIVKALDERFGHGLEFSFGGASIVGRDFAPVLSIDGLSLKDHTGRTVLSAPRAEVAVDLLALALGEVTPKRLDVFDVALHFTLRPDGSLALPAAADSGEAVPLTPPLAESLAREAIPDKSTPGAAFPESAPALAETKPRALLVRQMSSAIRLIVDSLTNPESPIAAIDRIGIARGRLVIDDETTNQTIKFEGVDLAFDKSSGGTTFNLSVDGPNGRWTVRGLASGLPGSERKLMLSLNNLSLDEILIATGSRSVGADFDMPLSAKFDLALQADGRLSEAIGRFEFGAGYLRFDDPNDEPMLVNKIDGGFHWDGLKRRIVLDRTELTAEAAHGAISGFVALPDREGEAWVVDIVNAGPILLSPERPGQKTVTLDKASLAARLFVTEKNLVIDRFAFGGPEVNVSLSGIVDWINGPRVKFEASMPQAPAAAVLRIWPSFMVSPVRSWLLEHARGGVVQNAKLQFDFDAPTLNAMRSEHAPPDDSILFDFTLVNGAVEYLPGVPPLRGISGAGHVTGRTSTFTLTSAGAVEAGPGRMLSVGEGSFWRVADSELKPTPAVIVAKVSGSVEAVADLLAFPALKPYASLPLDNANLRGQIDGKLQIDLRLSAAMKSSDVTLGVNATVTNFTADNILGKEKLDAATLTINVDREGLRASGQGRMFGAPASIDIVHPNGKTPEASVRMILDEAARVKQGLGNLPGLSGPVGALITAPLGGGEKQRAEVELDLTRAGIDLPGVVKPPGRPGKAKFSLAVNDNGTMLDPFVLEALPIMAHGQVELGTDQVLQSAHFPVAKISPGDDLKIDALRAGETLKIIVRASTIDAAPFVKWLTAASPAADATPANAPGAGAGGGGGVGGGSGAGAIKELDFDVKSALLSGYNRQVITGAELRLLKREQLKQFSFSGRFGHDTISGNLTGAPAAPQINLFSDDAGALLSFFDFYKHMDRGRLAVSMRLAPTLSGTLTIDSFVLRDEPALRRLVAESAPPPDASGRRPKIDAGAMAFTRLQSGFQRVGTRMQINDGTMYGDAIGLTVDGWLDYARDKVDVKGTFVPAYAVNNLFSKIPVFGAILGGGTNEGLFGVNFRIEGSITSPTLSINPLSALAPGIFRQIFGVGDPLGAARGLK
ncbi:DUF3971 domain-containing protein [Methylocapsa palsarum]|uniref:AsmA-like C-terminal region n=1 Tax=Methylocapsa palsarum TaxID=1612308 RepID=A0A1I4AFL1_9HYPH|nr:DUF3971 domain-containing protein [Methylocapsa palsarum]SFK54731.1 AsmA-like C-terminal region [Methylocapsa palsarum]